MSESKRAKITRQVSTVIAVGAGAALLAGGTAYAADKVTSWEIKDQTIRGQDIKAGAVGASEIRGNAVRKHHIPAGQVGWQELNDYARGRADAGANEFSGYQVDGFYKPVTANGGIAQVKGMCADGKYALGGGFSTEFDQSLEHVEAVVANHSSSR